MRYEITWHQLVEWQQYYELDPFGNERADLRSAMAGVTIANEIRTIAAGLAGEKLDPIQVKNLMIDTGKGRKPKRSKKTGSDSDRIAAENYYKLWSQSIKAKVKEAESPNPGRPSRARKRPSLSPS